MMARRRLMQLILVAFLAYASIGLGVFVFQRRLIFPYRGTGAMPVLAGANVERVAGAEGRTVHLLYVPAPDGAPTLVHFHGNGEELSGLTGLVGFFRDQGLGVLAVEYPGYGLSRAHEPTESAIDDDAEAALRYLLEKRGVSRETLVLSGQSLGSGVAVEMARRGYGTRVILISPYTSIAEAARKFFPFLPTKLLVRDTFDSASKAPDIRSPVLVVHGTDDEVIPFALGRKLAGLFPNARFFPVERGHHTDLFSRGPEVLTTIVAFARGER